jgi:hypothetical protein
VLDHRWNFIPAEIEGGRIQIKILLKTRYVRRAPCLCTARENDPGPRIAKRAEDKEEIEEEEGEEEDPARVLKKTRRALRKEL